MSIHTHTYTHTLSLTHILSYTCNTPIHTHPHTKAKPETKLKVSIVTGENSCKKVGGKFRRVAREGLDLAEIGWRTERAGENVNER